MVAMPLSGIRVLDMSRVLAAPWATQYLADFGADVIKVERLVTGDEVRYYGPPFVTREHTAAKESGYFLAANRNKRSICVDFANPRGRDILHRLAKGCDIFVENFKVGDLARHGMDFETLRQVNDKIIYCSVTGWGQTGPYAANPGVDGAFQALSGLMSITGEPDGPPQKVGVSISDLMAGMYAISGILTALRHRDVNDVGAQHIDISLLDSTIAMLSHRAMDYIAAGEPPRRMGSTVQGAAPAEMFPCKTGQICIFAGSDAWFTNLCGLLGCTELLSDPRFINRAERVRNRVPLRELLIAILAQRTAIEWFDILSPRGIICSPIHDIPQAFDNEHVKSRELIATTRHDLLGDIDILKNPTRISGVEIPYRAPPTIGGHTDEVLGELLQLDAAELADLRACGAIG